jgi:hypothetical protein
LQFSREGNEGKADAQSGAPAFSALVNTVHMLSQYWRDQQHKDTHPTANIKQKGK